MAGWTADKDTWINITEIFVRVSFKLIVTQHLNYQYKYAILNLTFQNYL